MPVYLRFRSVSFRFSPACYLRFCSRVLTASRAVTHRFDLLSHFMSDCANPPGPPSGSLNDLEESPGASVKRDGKALDAGDLAQRLGRYDIKSRNIRDSSRKVLKGYMREDFLDA